jgi:protein-tyrosine phosphatase
MLHVLMLCHGNICRSPLAEVLLEAAVRSDPLLQTQVAVTSAGTSDEHVGEGMHEHSAGLLARRGLRTEHRARQLTEAIARAQDLILAADRWNLRDARALLGEDEGRTEIRLLRAFDPNSAESDLADPWGHPIAAYERSGLHIDRAIPGILDDLRRRVLSSRSAVP